MRYTRRGLDQLIVSKQFNRMQENNVSGSKFPFGLALVMDGEQLFMIQFKNKKIEGTIRSFSNRLMEFQIYTILSHMYFLWLGVSCDPFLFQ